MTRRVVRLLILLLAVICNQAVAQPATGGNENAIAGALRTEFQRIRDDCSAGLSHAIGCAATLATDHPIHVSFGSIAPQNGFGVGPAFVWDNNNPNFPWDVSADGVRAPGGAWRAGAYFKLAQADRKLPRPVPAGQGSDPSAFIKTIPLYEGFVQTIALPSLPFYGIGNGSSKSDRAFYSMDETVIGANAVVPIRVGNQNRLSIALLGEVDERHIATGEPRSDDAPSLALTSLRSSATGFNSTRNFFEFGGGIRMKTAIGDRLRLNYSGRYQHFTTDSSAQQTFGRYTFDFNHEIPLYHTVGSTSAAESHTPNGCERGGDGRCVTPVAALRDSVNGTWNRTGTISARALVIGSVTRGVNQVPFYLQPTLGGSDINGQRSLASYDDYRFTGTRLLVFQESFEHSIAGPVGAWIEFSQGRVGVEGESVTRDLRHSMAIGASLRAGAAPMLTVSYATGGSEGHHIAVVVTSALLGGSNRPSWR